MAGFIDILRSGRWLTRERIRLVAFALLAAMMLGAGFLIATSNGLNDRFGRPLGTDFSNVYAAGSYVLDGEPSAPFDPPRQYAREQAIFGQATQFYGWHYPPFFLGLAALLATMPYWLALIVWQGVTLVLYVFAIRAILPAQLKIEHFWLLLTLAFPAVFVNLGQAHNGFLSAALLGSALTLLDRRPIVSGILIGCLAYKPQFGLLIPLVLIASGRWRAFASAAATVVVMMIAVTLAFGVDVWSAFLATGHFTRTVVLEDGGTGWYKIQSVFSWVRMWGGGDNDRNSGLRCVGERDAAAPHADPGEDTLDLVPAGAAIFEHDSARKMAGGEERAPHIDSESQGDRDHHHYYCGCGGREGTPAAACDQYQWYEQAELRLIG